MSKKAYDQLNEYIEEIQNGNRDAKIPDNYVIEDTILNTSDEKYAFLYEAIKDGEQNLIGVFVTCTKIKKSKDKIKYIVIPFSSYNSVVNDFDTKSRALGFTMKDYFNFNNAMLFMSYLKKYYNSKE